MNILGTARAYIKEMVSIAGPQMKVILMDKETTSIVSCAFAQSEMMQKEVRYQRSSEDCQRIAEELGQNVSSNFGEIGQNIKLLMNEFQQKSQIHKNLDSISDMKNFVEEYPQFKKISGTVSKHVTLVGELSRIVSNNNLLEISEVEQSIVAEGDHTRCLERIRTLLSDSRTNRLNAMRLVLLYALRFETNPNNDLTGLVNILRVKDSAAAQTVRNLLRYAGSGRRTNDLFGLGSTMEMTKSPRQDNVIIYILGGATFEETIYVRSMNEKRMQGNGGPAVVLASTSIHNTTSFIEQLASFTAG
uniref:Sec1 family domain-containing protein 2 n=1 Tax=Heterorhabditis bacteriophora TaxID=37862 RepID=A0A1I7XVC4_HETBA